MKTRTVLFVDDEVNILTSLKRGLLDEKYKKLFAQSGAEALKIMDSEPVHILVTDMRMPEMDGLKLLKLVREKHPHIVKMVLSGYTQLPQILATVNQVDIFKFITKPWSMDDEMIPIIRQAIDFYNLQEEKEELRANLERKNQLYQNVLRNINDRIAGQEKEMGNIIQLYDYTSNHINDFFEKSECSTDAKARLTKLVELYKKLNFAYLKSLPAIISEFDFETLAVEFKNSMDKYINQEFITAGMELKPEKLHGYYNLYKNMAETIVEILHSENANFKVNILVSKDKLFIISINILNALVKEEGLLPVLKEMNNFMNLILKNYNGVIGYRAENSDLNISLKFSLY